MPSSTTIRDDTTAKLPVREHSPVRQRQRNHWWTPCLMVLIRPAWTIRRYGTARWPAAVALHLLAVILVALLHIGWQFEFAMYRFEGSLIERVTSARLEMLTQYQSITEFFGELAARTLPSEIPLLIAVTLLLSWSSQEESVKTSVSHAVRRIFMLLPHVVLICIVVAVGAAMARYALNEETSYTHRHYYNYSQNRYLSILETFTWSLVWLWILYLSLTALSIRRMGLHCRWPACCEDCGYTIIALRPEHACPECGTPVQDTIGKHVRPGIPWQRNRPALWRWWQTTISAVRHPTQLGRDMRLISSSRSPQRLYLLQLLPAIVGFQVLYTWFNHGIIDFDDYLDEVMPSTALFTWLLVLGSVGLATFVGLGCSAFAQRNLMPGAIRGMSALMPFLFMSMLVTVFIIRFVDHYEHHIHRWSAHYLHLNMDTLDFAIILGWIGFVSASLLLLLIRITWATRYANR